MGYRHYLYKIKKEELNKIRNMSNSDLYLYTKSNEDDGWWSPLDLFKGKCIYCLGDIDNKLYKVLNNNKISEIFAQEEVKEHMEEYDNGILNADGFLKILELYKEHIVNYFKDLLKDGYEESWKKDKTSAEKLKEHIEEKTRMIENCNEYDFNLKNEQITDSWYYEYALFELIRLYKTIDWQNNYVVYLAY